ncbi:MAG: hypothetical protein L7U78_05915 [Schleiferiaceae bacterium]|nr:hypothetical protein [Schleiferiaceae bacterium]
MQSKDPSFSRKSSEQKLAELALNIGTLSHAEAAQQLLELSNEFRYYSFEAEIAAPFEKAAADLKAKLEAKLKALQEEAAATPTPVVEIPKVEEPAETSAPEPVKAVEPATVTEAEPVSSETSETLNQPEPTSSPGTKTPITEKKSLNDRLAGTVLKFGLNDRIGFVKELFDGSQEDFNRVVSQLNTCSSLEEATDYINAHISDEYGWDQKEETAARFMAAVEQKFS